MPVVPESGLNARLSDIVNELQGLPHVLQSVREARDRIALLEGALRLAGGAINAAYAQAHAEWHGHDRVAERHDRTVMEARGVIRQALAETEAPNE